MSPGALCRGVAHPPEVEALAPQEALLRLLAMSAVLSVTVPLEAPVLAPLVVKITRLVESVATVMLTVEVSKCGESIGDRRGRCDTANLFF